MFTSILNNTLTTASSSMSWEQMILCSVLSLVLGTVVALTYMFRNRYSKNLVISLVLLPIIVQSVIIMVNGNLGTGVAVLGAFSLIRFRSAPGSAREITAIFTAMAIGIATGMGHILFAVLITAIICAVMVLLTALKFGERRTAQINLKITIPEDLDYTGVFDDIFTKYTTGAELVSVRTTNMGSLFELRYNAVLKSKGSEKAMLDELRVRNGNLNIVCNMMPVENTPEML